MWKVVNRQNSYLELFLQERPWLAGAPRYLALGTQMPLISSGTPAAVSQPTGPEPPWLHCGAPSVDIHQLHTAGEVILI